jgi:hypothetical protein
VTESARLYRFRGGTGEVLEITAKGTVVTSRISALGFYAAGGKARSSSPPMHGRSTP